MRRGDIRHLWQDMNDTGNNSKLNCIHKEKANKKWYPVSLYTFHSLQTTKLSNVNQTATKNGGREYRDEKKDKNKG